MFKGSLQFIISYNFPLTTKYIFFFNFFQIFSYMSFIILRCLHLPRPPLFPLFFLLFFGPFSLCPRPSAPPFHSFSSFLIWSKSPPGRELAVWNTTGKLRGFSKAQWGQRRWPPAPKGWTSRLGPSPFVFLSINSPSDTNWNLWHIGYLSTRRTPPGIGKVPVGGTTLEFSIVARWRLLGSERNQSIH